MTAIKQTGFSIGNVVERFEHVMPKSDKEVSVIKQRLVRAGFRSESAVKMFYGWKVVLPLSLCAAGDGIGIGPSGAVFHVSGARWAAAFWRRISGWARGLRSGKSG